MKFLLLFFMSLAMSVSTLAKTNFVYCSEGSPSIFNPQLATDGATFNASSRTIYNRLVDFEYGGTKVVPSLASAWSVSKDGKTYTFDLRKNVEFHTTDYFTPTRKFSADDVLFTFNRMRLKDHSFHNVSNGTYTYFNAMGLDKLILDIKKISDYKVSFILKNQDATFLPNLAMDFASILSKEYGDLVLSKKTPQQIDLKPIGTGPFVFKKYVKDSLVRFFSFDKYFKGKPKIDNLIFSINTEASVRYQKLKTGECHFVTGPSPVDLEKMKADKNIKVLSQDGLNIGFLAMNVQKKPLDNLNVRRAIHHALNRESYIKAIFHNNATIAKNPLPPSMWSYNKEIKDLEFDISKAKDYLEKAGLKNGFEIDLWVPTISRPYNPDGKKMGEMIQADLAKVGIKVKLVALSWATYLEKQKKGEHKMALAGWTGDNGDPDNFLDILLSCQAVSSGNNASRWCNQEFSALLQQAKSTTDIKKRTELYMAAQQIFKQKIPWVTLAHAKVFKAMSSKVVGFKISPFGTDSFARVDLVE